MAGSELAAYYVSIVGSARGLTQSIAKEFSGIDTEADKAGKSSGGAFVKAFGALAAGAAIGAAITAGVSKSLDIGKATDKLAASLGLNAKESEQAGATAGKLYANAYGGSMQEVSSAVESVMSSVKGMRTASSADVEAMTAKVLDMSTAFEIDAGTAAQVAGQMITSGLAVDGVQAADLLTASLQKVPAAVRGDLMDAIDEYAPFMKNLGFSGGEAMSMLVDASAKGMYGIDKTGDALKEFGIRATDMSNASAAAYEALGMDQTEMTNKLLAGGDTARGAFDAIVSGLQGIQDPSRQSTAALALFGSPLEDLSVTEIPKFIDGLLNSQEALGTVEGAADRMGQTLNDNAATNLETFKRSAETAFVDVIGGKVVPILSEAMDGVKAFAAAWVANDGDITSSGFPGFMERLAYELRQAFDYVDGTVIPKLREFGQFLWDNRAAIIVITAAVAGYAATMGAMSIIATVRGWLVAAAAAQWGLNAAMTANPVGLIIAGIAALVAGLVWFFTQTDLGKSIVANAWAWIQSAVQAVVDWFQNTALPIIQEVFRVVGEVFRWLYENIIKPVWDGIMVVVNAAWLVMRGIFQLIASVIEHIVAPVFRWLYENVIKPAFDNIGKVISWVWENVIKPTIDIWVYIFENHLGPAFKWLYENIIKPAFDGIGSAIKWVWENVIKPVFDFLSKAINEDIPKAFDTGVAAVKKIWEGIQEIAKAPIRFVIDTVINDGLIGAFNTVAGMLPGIDKLPRVALPAGFANGGYTGDGGKYQPAGIVHAGEYVFTKEQTRKAGVGTLAAMAKSLNGYAKGGLVHPLPGSVTSSGFGMRPGGFHNGIDFAAATGTPVRAAGPGRVSMAGWSAGGGGNEIHIDHPNGLQTWYSHLSAFVARAGEMVRANQMIGKVGSTGNSTGPHLHYMVLNGGWPNYTNPGAYLDGGGEAGKGGFNPISGIIDGLLSSFKSAFPAAGIVADIAIGVGKKLLTSAGDFIMGNAGKDTGATALYDQGGVLPPGLSQVVNRTRKPEAILNPQQWDDMHTLATRGGAGGFNNYGTIHVRDEQEMARVILTRQQDALAVYR